MDKISKQLSQDMGIWPKVIKNGKELEKLIDKVNDTKWTSHFYGFFFCHLVPWWMTKN